MLSCGGGGGGDKAPTAPPAPPAPVMVLTTVSVSLSATTIQVGQTASANATGADQNGGAISTGAVTWSSSATAVATVSASGSITGVAVGQSNIMASAGSKSGQATLTVIPVPVPVASVRVAPATASIAVGATQQLTAATLDANNSALTGRSVTWSSSDVTKVTVSSSGLVTGIAPGSATITATSEGKSGTSSVTVLAPVAAVTVAPAAVSVSVGATQQLTATTKDAGGNVLTGRTVTWWSAFPSRATVSSSGLVTGVAEGSATIDATSEGKTGSAAVTVTGSATPVASVALWPLQATLYRGGTQQLTATLADARGSYLYGRPVTWSSSNTSVATVNSTGLVTAVAAGFATISATCEGKKGEAYLTVIMPVATITLSPTTWNVLIGGTWTYYATLKDANGVDVSSNRLVTWATSNAGVARVTRVETCCSQQGLVTGVAAGTATVTATSEGQTGSATVTVSIPGSVASVEVLPIGATLLRGSTQQFTATLRDASYRVFTGPSITWSTSNAAVATVSSTGLATGVSFGSATITATSEGKTGTASVSVTTPVATVTVSPNAANVLVGGRQNFTTSVKDADGNVLLYRTITWSTSAASIATVSNGLATGVAAGTATITATSEGKSGSAPLNVISGGGLACGGTAQLGCGLGLDQFSLIPAGTFQMGSSTSTGEQPVHSVTISRAFYMQKTEVTQWQWRAVMGTNPSYFNSGDAWPVDGVSWNDVQAFLQKLNANSPGVTYRLPTEAEWEYAARAGTTADAYGAVDAIAWYGPNAFVRTHAVGGKLANAWGLYDMLGNVWEWVNDWVGPYSSAPVTDPTGPSSGTDRVLRGGAFDMNSFFARAPYRNSASPSYSNVNGFRLVRVP